MQENTIIPNKKNHKKLIIISGTFVFLFVLFVYFYFHYQKNNSTVSDQDKFFYLEKLKNNPNNIQMTPAQKEAMLFFLKKQQEAIDSNKGSISAEQQAAFDKQKSDYLNNIK